MQKTEIDFPKDNLKVYFIKECDFAKNWLTDYLKSTEQLTLQQKTKNIAYHTQSTNPCATKGILSDRF